MLVDRGIIREKSWLPGKVFGNHKLYLLLLVSKLSELPIALYYSSSLLSLLNTLKCGFPCFSKLTSTDVLRAAGKEIVTTGHSCNH